MEDVEDCECQTLELKAGVKQWVRDLEGYDALEKGKMSLFSFLVSNNVRCFTTGAMYYQCANEMSYEDAKKAPRVVDTMPVDPSQIPDVYAKSMTNVLCNPNDAETAKKVVTLSTSYSCKVWYTDTRFPDDRIVFDLQRDPDTNTLSFSFYY